MFNIYLNPKTDKLLITTFADNQYKVAYFDSGRGFTTIPQAYFNTLLIHYLFIGSTTTISQARSLFS